MPIVKLLPANHAAEGTWRTNSAEATLPVCHLGDERRGRVWRSTSACAGRWVIADLAAAKSIEAFALVGANITTGASVFLEAACTSGRLSTTTSTSTLAAFGQSLTPWSPERSCCLVWFLSAAQEYKHWRVLLTDSGNGAGYLEAGVVVLACAVSMAVGPRELRYEVVDPSVVDYAASGTPRTYERDPYAVVRLPHRFLAESLVFGSLQDVVRTLGKRDGVLSLFSSEAACSAIARQTNLYGRLTRAPEFAYVVPELYDWQLEFRESL